MKLRRPKPGDAIRASDIGAIVDALVHRIVGVQGVEVRRTRGSVTIGLAASAAPGWRPGRIVEVVKPADPAQASALSVWYWAASVGKSDAEAVEIPADRVFGRIDYTGEVRLVPAKVGDPCAIRDWIMPDGSNEPVMEVWTEAPAVDPACPPEGAGNFGGGSFGGFVEVMLAPQAQGPAAEATSEMEEAGMSSWDVEVEVEDLSLAGRDYAVAVPRGATVASAHLVALGVGGTPPLCAITEGRSNSGANAVYENTPGLTLAGTLGDANRVALKRGIVVEGVGYLHLRVTAPQSGTAIGSGTIYVRFERGDGQ